MHKSVLPNRLQLAEAKDWVVEKTFEKEIL